jgi:uncharacterized protein YbaR (Trm112 family)
MQTVRVMAKIPPMAIDMALLQSFGVCCPVCQGDLTLAAAGAGLDCAGCAVRYAIVDDIPVLLPDSGRPINATTGGAASA